MVDIEHICRALSHTPLDAHSSTLVTLAEHCAALHLLVQGAGAATSVCKAAFVHRWPGERDLIFDALGVPRMAQHDPRLLEADALACRWAARDHGGGSGAVGLPSGRYPLFGGHRTGWQVDYPRIEQDFRKWTKHVLAI